MDRIKAALLFVLKAFVCSVIFFCTVFGIYAISPLCSSRKHEPDKSNVVNMDEYNRQLEESAKIIERQKVLLKRVEANTTEQEKNAKRMASILEIWERQARQGK